MYDKQERTDNSGGGRSTKYTPGKSNHDYTPYIIGGVILLAILAAIIF